MEQIIGDEGQGTREIVWYLAKCVPDPLRNEPRNIGIIVRVAETEDLAWRFEELPPVWAPDPGAYRDRLKLWIGTMKKYQATCLRWLPKRKVGDSLYIELGGRDLKPGRVNISALYKRLVAPIQKYIVHGIHGGLPDCGFTRAVPAEWPPEHRWSYELVDVNCLDCMSVGGVWNLPKPAEQIDLPPPGKDQEPIAVKVGDAPIILKPPPSETIEPPEKS